MVAQQRPSTVIGTRTGTTTTSHLITSVAPDTSNTRYLYDPSCVWEGKTFPFTGVPNRVADLENMVSALRAEMAKLRDKLAEAHASMHEAGLEFVREHGAVGDPQTGSVKPSETLPKPPIPSRALMFGWAR